MNELIAFTNIHYLHYDNNVCGGYSQCAQCTHDDILHQLENSELNEIIIYVCAWSYNTCKNMISDTQIIFYERNTDTHKSKYIKIKISKTTLRKKITVKTHNADHGYNHVIDEWLEQHKYMFK